MRKWHCCSNAPKIGLKYDTRWGRGFVQCCTSGAWARLWEPAALLEPSRPPDTPNTSAAGAGTSSAEQHRRKSIRTFVKLMVEMFRGLWTLTTTALGECISAFSSLRSLSACHKKKTKQKTDRLTEFSQVDKPLSVACLVCCDPYDHYIHKKDKV